MAMELSRANENAIDGDGQATLGELLEEAYEKGQLQGCQIIEAKRLIKSAWSTVRHHPTGTKSNHPPPVAAWCAPSRARSSAPLNTMLRFELERYQIPRDQSLPSKKVLDGMLSTRKYKQIVSSIKEMGMIELLSVIQPDSKKPEYLVLDGRLRVMALKELGMNVGPCLFDKDDESYSYNHHVNRLSTIAEHYMICRGIEWGVSKERLARAFYVNLSSINRRISLLEDICPEAITLLQDKQFTPDVTRILRNIKAARQVEAVELMIASNTITVAYAEALHKATPPEQRTDLKPAEREKKTAPIDQIEKLEKEYPSSEQG